MNLLINLLLAVYVLVALLMVLVILMQRPKSEGLGAAFGGASAIGNSLNVVTTGSNNTVVVTGAPSLTDSARVQMNVVRAGVNYRF